MNSDRLKKETKEYHDSIERVMNSSLIFSNRFTVDHYNKFIQHSYKYIDYITPIIEEEWPEYSPILAAKHSALLKDIIAPLPFTYKKNFPIENNRYYYLGLLYIVLGAMLGNKIILKKLKEYPSFEGYQFAYLSEHQENLSEIWHNFQNKINALNSDQLDKVIQGAKDGYSLFSE